MEGISDGFSRSLSYCAGLRLRAKIEPEIVLRVVSLPPMISKPTFPWNSCRSISRVAGPWASMEIRSNRGSEDARSRHISSKAPKHSSSWLRFCSQLVTGPKPGALVIMSDQWVSFRRSSKGKSNRVAKVMAVSSLETRSTQSNGVPIGSPSRMTPARSRITGSIL